MTDTDTRLLTGWGRTQPSAASVTVAGTAQTLRDALTRAGAASSRGVIARGLGRSYGDAALNAGGRVVDMTTLNEIVEIDRDARTARVQAGVSLEQLMHASLPLGLWPYVSPGTRQVTVGGAIAADVHGKNHHRDGTFGSHVRSLTLHTPALGELELGPDREPDIFLATTGGMGLTGLISAATLELTPVETSSMLVDTIRAPDLDEAMAALVEMDQKFRYCVAWIDCLARGPRLGRSVVEGGEHALLSDLPAKQQDPERALRFDTGLKLPSPPWAPSWLLNRASIAAFNELWYRKAPVHASGHVVPAASFFHPLDMVARWNRIYGRGGFLQYQMVVPDGEEQAVRTSIELLSGARCASFLAVLKRFGAANQAPLSFPQAGWTLALDIPARLDGLGPLLDRLDQLVAGVGGRVYLAKDSRLRPELLETMYPELPRWREVRARVDPNHVLRSDLSRRLPALVDG